MKITSANDNIHASEMGGGAGPEIGGVTPTEDEGSFTNHNGQMWAQDFETYRPEDGGGHKDASGVCPGGCPAWTHYGPDDFDPDDDDPWTNAMQNNLDSTYGHVYDHTSHGGGFVGDGGYAGPSPSGVQQDTTKKFDDLESAMDHAEESRPYTDLGLDDRDSYNRDYGEDNDDDGMYDEDLEDEN